MGWTVLTRDKRIRSRKLERLTLEAHKVRAFVFTGGNVTGTETGRILCKALPRIEKLVRREPGPFIYHIGRAGRPVQMK